MSGNFVEVVASSTPTGWHCQICGRNIKAAKGNIAHHGYRMPHGRRSGWRTGSCLGTRFRPYEVASDRIAHVIDRVEAAIQDFQEQLAKAIATPPATLSYNKKGYWEEAVFVEVPRPEGFKPEASMTYCIERYSYAALYRERLSDLRGSIAEDTETLAYLRARLANWKAIA